MNLSAPIQFQSPLNALLPAERPERRPHVARGGYEPSDLAEIEGVVLQCAMELVEVRR